MSPEPKKTVPGSRQAFRKRQRAVQTTPPTEASTQYSKRDTIQRRGRRRREDTYVERAVQDGAGVLVLEPHGVGRHIVEAHRRVPGGDQQELGGVGAELHRGDAVLGGLVQLELVRTGHLRNKRPESPRGRGLGWLAADQLGAPSQRDPDHVGDEASAPAHRLRASPVGTLPQPPPLLSAPTGRAGAAAPLTPAPSPARRIPPGRGLLHSALPGACRPYTPIIKEKRWERGGFPAGGSASSGPGEPRRVLLCAPMPLPATLDSPQKQLCRRSPPPPPPCFPSSTRSPGEEGGEEAPAYACHWLISKANVSS